MTEKILQRAILALGVAAIAAAIWLVAREPVPPDIGQGNFALAATDGTSFTEASLQGQPSAVFFSFTHCPDVCPTTLGEIGIWQEELGDAAKDLRFRLVTVDPERDTVDQLREYLSWNAGVTGAASARAEVDRAIAAFRIYARKVPLSDGSYTMDHTPHVMRFDRNGAFVQTIAYREEARTAVGKLRDVIAAG